MEERFVDLYRQTLADALEHDDLNASADSIKSAIKTMIRREGESAAVNFVLYTFYSTDKVATQYIREGFKNDGEKEFFTRLLLIEQDLEAYYDILGHSELFNKAITVYKGAVNNA
jgi:hypothetical protein